MFERKVCNEHHEAAKDIPTRSERREIEELREELAAQTQALLDHEKRSKLNVARLEKRIKVLISEKEELADEVKALEQLRLNAWETNAPQLPSSRKDDNLGREVEKGINDTN